MALAQNIYRVNDLRMREVKEALSIIPFDIETI